MQWRPQHRPHACLSCGVKSKMSLYFKISRASRASCRCLPFNFKKMAAVSVTVFEENKVLCQGRLLRVSVVDMLLLWMKLGLLSTSETSEFVAGCLHLVSTAASVEQIRHDAAPDNKVFLHVEFGRYHVFSIYAVLSTWRTRTPQLQAINDAQF